MIVGFSMNLKKSKNFLEPFTAFLRSWNVDAVVIDFSQCGSEFPHVDVLVHKLTDYMVADAHDAVSSTIMTNLATYLRDHPTVLQIDRLDNIRPLLDRSSMYDMLSSLSYPEQFGGVPRYITANSAAEAVSAATASNLCYPLVVKTVMACGKHDSHVLEIVSSPEHLLQCAVRPPLICQEYINHDGVVHKVYVVDDYVRVVKRQSVRNISESENFHGSFNSQHELPDELANRKMVHANANGNAVLEDQGDPQVESAAAHAAALIREKFGLHLFGFDLLQSSETNGGRLFVVDINYFPSYKKMPDIYERIWDFVQREYNCRVHG